MPATNHKTWFVLIASGALTALTALAVWNEQRAVSGNVHERGVEIARTGPFTIAATGDSLISHPIPTAEKDSPFRDAVHVLRSASLAMTNLETTLLRPEAARSAQQQRAPRQLFGSRREAAELKALGFEVVDLANNHATDYGEEGLLETTRVLDDAFLLHVGTGRDLTEARTPVFVGSRPRRVALIALATSSTPEARATASRSNIKGRPGLSPLRYRAAVTVDPRTYATLKEATPQLPGTSSIAADQLSLLGITIAKGAGTSVDVQIDESDFDDVVQEVRGARAQADVVVVAVHSHEPSNDSDQPAQFFRRFAHAAIDSGATFVVGHGPHRLRGIEVYRGGVIVYSLGNFLDQSKDSQGGAKDLFDSGVDMYSLATGLDQGGSFGPRAEATDPASWDSVIAVLTLTDDLHPTLQLYPLDLGADLPSTRKGTPRMAAPGRAAAILNHLARLSAPFETKMSVTNGIGIIELSR